MMKQYSKVILCVTLFGALFSSCQKDDNGEPTNFIQSKEWKPGLVDKKPSTNPSGRILYNAVQNCQKDDTYRFNANNTLTINQGKEKCSTNEEVIKNVSYSYNSINKELIIDGSKYKLAEESNVQLKYYAPLPSNTGYDYIVFLLD